MAAILGTMSWLQRMRNDGILPPASREPQRDYDAELAALREQQKDATTEPRDAE